MRASPAVSFLTSRRLRWIVVSAAVAAMVVLLLVRGELRPAAESILRADWRWVAGALVLMLVSLLLRSLALRLIGRACEAQPRLRDAFSSTSIGLLANALVPVRVGAFVNPYVLFVLLRRRGVRVPFATALGMTVTEQLFSAATFVLFGLAVVSLLAAPAWAEPALLACAAGLGLLFAAAVLVQVRRERRRAAGLPSALVSGPRRPGWRGALVAALPHFADAQRVLARPVLALLVGAVQAVAWGIQLAAVVAVLHAFHLGQAGWAGAALVILLTNLIGILPLTPGNVGTFQLAATAALTAAGAPAGPALAVALGLQGLQLLVGVSAGLVSLSLQDLSFAELAGKTREAAERLRRGASAPTPAGPRAGA